MTTGVWYVERTTLHLLLANYRAVVSVNNIREVLDRDPLFEVLSAARYEFVQTEHSKEGSEKKSLLSSLRHKTPHLAIEYTQLLAEELDQNGPEDEEGQVASSVKTENRKDGVRLGSEQGVGSLCLMDS